MQTSVARRRLLQRWFSQNHVVAPKPELSRNEQVSNSPRVAPFSQQSRSSTGSLVPREETLARHHLLHAGVAVITKRCDGVL